MTGQEPLPSCALSSPSFRNKAAGRGGEGGAWGKESSPDRWRGGHRLARPWHERRPWLLPGMPAASALLSPYEIPHPLHHSPASQRLMITARVLAASSLIY